MTPSPLLETLSIENIKTKILDVPHFPKEGILFKDITPLLQDPLYFRSCIRRLAEKIESLDFNKFVAVESRGFLFGSALSEFMHRGLVLVRKPGKLPRKTMSTTYDLEYGKDTLEIHSEDLKKEDKIIIVDDVLATGGTAQAVENLCAQTPATITGHLFLIELLFLEGKKKLKNKSYSLIQY